MYHSRDFDLFNPDSMAYNFVSTKMDFRHIFTTALPTFLEFQLILNKIKEIQLKLDF